MHAASAAVTSDGGAATFGAAIATALLVGAQWAFGLDPYPPGLEASLATLTAGGVAVVKKLYRDWRNRHACRR